VWTLIQCFDLCLRSNLCDSYIFNRQEFGEHNCTLLNTDMAQISGGDNLYVKSGLCGTFRSRDDKNLHDYVLGRNSCSGLTNDDNDGGFVSSDISGSVSNGG